MVKPLARPGLGEDDAFTAIGRERGIMREAGSAPLSPTSRALVDKGARG